MSQSPRCAFLSPDGPSPTAMASPLLRFTSVRLPALVLLLVSVTTVQSSQGDKEPVYRDCVKQCVRTNCTGARLRGFQSTQPQYMALTGELLTLMPGELANLLTLCGIPHSLKIPAVSIILQSCYTYHQ